MRMPRRSLNVSNMICWIHLCHDANIFLVQEGLLLLAKTNKVKPVLRDQCHERPPVMKDHTFLAEGRTLVLHLNITGPPVLTDHIFVVNGVVFQERFYCTNYSGSNHSIHNLESIDHARLGSRIHCIAFNGLTCKYFPLKFNQSNCSHILGLDIIMIIIHV